MSDGVHLIHSTPSRSWSLVLSWLLFAAGIIIVRAADHGWTGLLATAITTVLLVTTRVNPLLVMIGAGFLGWLGLIR